MAGNDLYNKNRRDPDRSIKNTIKDKIVEGGQKFKKTLKNTSIEVALLAALGLGIGGYVGTKAEFKRAEKIPLAFSEIEAVEKQLEKNNEELGAISEYSMKINDMCMKIFEAYNESQSILPNRKTDIFASNIYDAISLRNIYKYNLQDLLTQIPTYIPQINETLEQYKKISDYLDIINKNMSKSWEDDHKDNYHTETRVRLVTDSKGNTRTETYTVQVYDNTTHTYKYNKNYGEAGSDRLTELFTEHPIVELNETILKTNETNAEGEYAAEKSRIESFSKKTLTQEDLLSIANTWHSGSTILNNLDYVEGQYPKLKGSAIERDIAKETAHSKSYKTTSRVDPGPKEFQIAKNTLNLGLQINNSLKEIQNLIETTNIKVPLLEQKIKEFIESGYIKSASSEKEAKKLAKEIVRLTKEIYKMNFKDGVDVDRFRWAMIFLYALIGLVSGGVLGAGVDYLDNKKNIYDRFDS